MEIIINEEMIKNDFIEYMETICMNNIDNASITRNINIMKNDLWKFIQFTKDINFVAEIPDEINEYLSPYRTFYDRINFYYDSDDLLKYNIDERCQIIACEIINNLMGYYKIKKMGERHKDTLYNRALTTMYHYGFIKHRLWYSVETMHAQHIKIQNKYNDFDYKVFRPNAKAAEYLFYKMFDEKYHNKLCILDKFETTDIIEYICKPIIWEPKEYGMKLLHEDNRSYMFHKPTQKFITSKSISKLREHYEAKEIIARLSI